MGKEKKEGAGQHAATTRRRRRRRRRKALTRKGKAGAERDYSRPFNQRSHLSIYFDDTDLLGKTAKTEQELCAEYEM